MKLNRLVCNAILATVTVMSLFGCSQKTESIIATDATTAKVEEKKTEEKNEEEKEPVSFTYWIAIHAQTAEICTDHNDHPAAKALEESTGVLVDYINPPIGQEKEQMNLLLANPSEGLPDLMRFDFGNNYRGGVDSAIADGIILDATDLIEEYAPNFMAYINADENIRRSAYTDNGAIAYFGTTFGGEGMGGRPFQGPMVNKTLLDKAGLDVPVTIADWEEMLAAFKDMGVKIPFSFGCNNTFSSSCDAFAGAYDVPMGAQFMNENGTVKFGPMQPGYKEFLTLFHKWYENGWLDTDFLSKNQNKEIRNDFDAGVMGAAILHINSVISAPLVSVQQNNEENIAIPVPYPVVTEGDQLHFRHYLPTFNMEPTFISATAENPVEIVKWVDYLYSEEGIRQTCWGTEGTDEKDIEHTYYVNENGEYKYTDKINNNPEGITSDQAYRYFMMRDTCMVWENQAVIFEDPRQQEGWTVWGDTADYDYVMPTTLILTLEENEKYSKLMGDITTYVNEMSAKFIMGIEPLEDYDKFLATLENLKIAEATAIKQAALDRYLSR